MSNEISNQDLEILRLKGDIGLLRQEIDWWASEQDFWRSKFLREHPELDNWDYVERARKEGL